jgi:hypothetical protein
VRTIDPGVAPVALPPGWRVVSFWIETADAVEFLIRPAIALVQVRWRNGPGSEWEADGWEVATLCEHGPSLEIAGESDNCINGAFVGVFGPGEALPGQDDENVREKATEVRKEMGRRAIAEAAKSS